MAKSLFEASEQANFQRAQPLAARMRPQTLDEFVGQQHFLGEGKLLRRLLTADRIGSVIFYGPPGTGKTTLARLLASESRRKFRQLSAVTSGVKELREVLQDAESRQRLWRDGYERYYPGGVDDPDYTDLRFKASSGHYYNALTKASFDL